MDTFRFGRSTISLGKSRIRVGETEIAANDWTLNLNRDSGERGNYVSGLLDMSGSFSGTLDEPLLGADGGQVEVLLFAPSPLPWYRAWWIRLVDKEWPDEIVAHGPAYVSAVITKSDDQTRVRATFIAAGGWSAPLKKAPTWAGKWDRLRLRFWLLRHCR